MDAGNRPGTWQRLRVGARRDGSLTAISLASYGTAGIGLGAGVGNFAAGDVHLRRISKSAQHDVFINAGPGCAMRAPGNVPGAWAMEQAIDELAERLVDRPDGVARPDRPEPDAARGAAYRCRADRLGASARARRRSRPDEARPRHGAVTLGRQRADQCGLRGARHARRFGRSTVERAGYRHRHRHRAGPSRRRGAGTLRPKRSSCGSAIPIFRPGRPPMEAARPLP